MMNAVQLGSLLRRARENCGLSQQAVAKALDLPRTAVVNMERGNRAVSTLDLIGLAKVYGCSAADFLVPDDKTDTENPYVVLQRVLPEMEHAQEVKDAIQKLLDLYSEGMKLRRMLGQETEQKIPNYAAPMAHVGDAIRQGEAVAQEERRRLGLGNSPVRNMVEILSGQGIWAAATQLPDSLSGLFINHEAIGKAILVNRLHSLARRHFSYSHEYAHALFDHNNSASITRRGNLSNLIEKRANAFAAAFLMPPAGIAERMVEINKRHTDQHTQIGFDIDDSLMIETNIRLRKKFPVVTYQDAAVLAHHFGVSFEAIIWRLKNLDHIHTNKATDLIEQKDIGSEYIKLLGFQKRSEEGATSTESKQELYGQVIRLAMEAFQQAKISQDQFIEIGGKLDIDRDFLHRLTQSTHPGD